MNLRRGQHVKYWKQLTDRMAMICLDLEKLPQVGSKLSGKWGATGPLEWVTTGYYLRKNGEKGILR